MKASLILATIAAVCAGTVSAQEKPAAVSQELPPVPFVLDEDTTPASPSSQMDVNSLLNSLATSATPAPSVSVPTAATSTSGADLGSSESAKPEPAAPVVASKAAKADKATGDISEAASDKIKISLTQTADATKEVVAPQEGSANLTKLPQPAAPVVADKPAPEAKQEAPVAETKPEPSDFGPSYTVTRPAPIVSGVDGNQHALGLVHNVGREDGLLPVVEDVSPRLADLGQSLPELHVVNVTLYDLLAYLREFTPKTLVYAVRTPMLVSVNFKANSVEEVLDYLCQAYPISVVASGDSLVLIDRVNVAAVPAPRFAAAVTPSMIPDTTPAIPADLLPEMIVPVESDEAPVAEATQEVADEEQPAASTVETPAVTLSSNKVPVIVEAPRTDAVAPAQEPAAAAPESTEAAPVSIEVGAPAASTDLSAVPESSDASVAPEGDLTDETVSTVDAPAQDSSVAAESTDESAAETPEVAEAPSTDVAAESADSALATTDEQPAEGADTSATAAEGSAESADVATTATSEDEAAASPDAAIAEQPADTEESPALSGSVERMLAQLDQERQDLLQKRDRIDRDMRNYELSHKHN